MSAASPSKKSAARWVAEAVALALVFGVLWAAVNSAPSFAGDASVLGAVGLLLLSGTLMSELLSAFKLPHLTGYIAAGVVAGPHVLHLIDEHTVESLSPVNTLALALIAFAGGTELKVDDLKKSIRSLLSALSLQTLIVFLGMFGVFVASRSLISFTRELPILEVVGIGALWGVVAASRSPAATLGVLAQTRAKGPLTSFCLAFVMASDVVIVVMIALVMSLVRPLFDAGATFSTEALSHVGHELLGSVSIGTTLGLVLALYLRFVGKQLLVVLVALGFGATEVLHYMGFEPLLAFLVAGAVVQNLSKQGDKFLHAIEQTSGVVYVVFFASAGAHLKLPLLAELWPIALLLAGSRAALTWVSAQLSSALVKDPPVIRRWAWASMVSQAGLTLGIVAMIQKQFPQLGAGLGALAIATVAINEIVGPILFKLSLDRNGESQAADEGLAEQEEPRTA